MKEVLRENKKNWLILQIVGLITVYAVIFLFVRERLPDLTEFVTEAEKIYNTYGYYLIFLGALIEATFILGFYIPGSLIVFLGVSFARLGITSFPLVIFFSTLGFVLGYTINYCLGRFGWYKVIEGIGFEKQINEAKGKLKKHYAQALFWGYVMPSTGSMLSTASGVLRVDFWEFILKTVIIQVFWSLFLGGLAYIFGQVFINLFLVYFGLIAFVGMVMYLLRSLRKEE